jgi:O-methyltransferase involved in polyketide biosynthesis
MDQGKASVTALRAAVASAIHQLVDDEPKVLTVAGFDGTQPACFSWLGVTQYLTLPAIDQTLRFVAGPLPQAPSS